MENGHSYFHKVQYYETDQMGIVHHSNYIRWFEEARTDFLEYMNIRYDDMEKAGIYSPVIEVEAKYIRMIKFGDLVSITPQIVAYNGFKLFVAYEITSRETGMVHCKGMTKHCFLDRKAKPIFLKKQFEDYHRIFMENTVKQWEG